MNSFSSVTIVGRLTRNAELKNTQSGNSVLSFTVAVDRRKKGPDGNFSDETMFIDVSYFSQNAMNICQFMEKGLQVGIVGELNMRKWVSNDGVNHSKIEVIASNVHIIESKEASELRRTKQSPSDSPQPSQGFSTRSPQQSGFSGGNFTRMGVNLSKSTEIKQETPDFGPDSFDDDQDVPF